MTIHRKGLGRVGHSKGDKRVAMSTIIAVKMRPAGAMANGFIRFDQMGGSILRDKRGGLSDATTDENAVIFRKSQQAAFNAIREHVENYIEQKHAGESSQSTPLAPNIADQIKQLAELRDSGILNEDEFAAKKADLLSRM
ncbi:MAG: SHOCT domain-containing protein [Antricoccus sp.]